MIYRVGSGSGSLVSTGNPVFLDEYTPTGMLVQSIPMPTADALPNRAFYASGTAGSEGMLTRSADGRYLVLTGYASTYTSSLAGTSGTLVNRVIGRVDVTSAIDTTTALTDFASGNNPRSATSDNGARFWAAGAAGGVRYAALGASTSTDLTSASLANARQVSLFAGQLYTSSDRANFKGVNAIGTGLPTTPSQPVVRLFGLTDATSPSGYSYFFADLTDAVPGFDTLYIADDSSNATGGVQKYSLVGGTWVANGSVEGASNAYRGLVGKVNGTTTTLYATRKGGSGATGGGELVSLVDATGYNATITATSSIIAAAAANTSFRGVAFAPELCGNVVCTPLDQCHDAGVCNPATGACSNPVKADGAGCSDGNACTVNDSCTAGVCGGTSYSCDDSNPCTVDSCNGDGTCTNSPYSCDDSNACTIDACNGDGTCTNTPHSCDDSNPCTDDSCNGDGSCTHTPRVPCGFTPGDVVIYRVGSGTGSLVNTGNPVFLDEFTPGGMLVQSVPMPIADALPNRAFYASGTASSEGMLTRSADGRYLVLTGYASTSTSSLSGTSGTTVNRVIGRVNAASAINTSTALTDFASGNNPRSATSDNGARFWASGGAGGVRYAALGASTSIDLTSAILANARQVSIFAGQLYGSSDRTNFKGVNAIGAGLPTTPSQPVVRLPGLTDTTSPSSFSYFFADLTDSVTGFDTLYIADDSNSATGGVQKYSLVGGTWVANGSVEGSGNTYRGLVGKVDGTTVTIYATRKGGGGATGGGELVSLVDATGYNVTITATSTVLATAAASTAFRGVAFAPEGIDLCAGVVCTALDQCHDTGVCDPATGICSDPLKPSGAACDDGDACTAGETCDSGGVCRGGAAIDCNDLDVCTTDTCSGGQCLHVPSGSCGVGGTVWYYRNSVTDSEPSAKGTPNVGIDVTGDLVAEATTGGGGGGGYSILNLAGNTTVRTLNKFGSPRASDHNDAVGSYDAAAISRYVVGLQSLSGNQLIAGDVTGNGQVTSYDAAKVAQFGVELIDHFDVAAATGSDWKFLRCDVYGSAVDQNCGPAAYPAPLTGMATDNFYAVLYGDVTGNWEAATAYARSTSAESEAEAAAADDDRRMAAELRPMAGRILGRPEGMPGAVLTVGNLPRVAGAGSRVEIGLDLRNADGIEALDLRLLYDPDRIRVVDVRTGGLAPQFKLATGDSGGDRRIGMYGVLPLQGSGRLLTVTVEVLKSGRLSRQFSIEASANEGRIPLRVRGGATAGKP
ncbi:MAG: hypothetical protein LAO51_15315 [Acidobacteriia bacterium]|nr:hypothetical protein [Terriglobia bacterium]